MPLRSTLGGTRGILLRSKIPPSINTSTLADVYNNSRTGVSRQLGGVDSLSEPLTYSLVSGSLPTGLVISAATGVISGNANAVGSVTTSNFTIRCTGNDGAWIEQAHSMTIYPANYKVTFSHTGAQQNYTVPTGVTSITMKVWGGGGASGGSRVGTFGGSSGYSSGTLSVSSGQSYAIVVGGGGNHSRNAACAGGYGGGGNTGNPQSQEGASSGGGYSGVFASNIAFGNARIIAAGGGGGAGCGTDGYANSTGQVGFGGAGGGTSGQNATGNYWSANGASQSGGGNNNAGTNSGGNYNGQSGSQLQGGRGGDWQSAGNHSAGGGGGGGYYGGAGGRGGEGGVTAGDAGGGGSSYTGGVSSGSTSTGTGSGQYDTSGGRPPPPNTGDGDYVANTGYAGFSRSSGSNGAVIFLLN